MDIFVRDIWVIPLLPLIALVLNLFIIRPLDVAYRDRSAHAGAAHDGHAEHSSSEAHYTAEELIESSYVSALDTIDGHIDTPAAMNHALQTAQKTSGGKQAVALMRQLEQHPEHPHGKPTIYARLAGYVGIAGMFGSFAWAIGALFAMFNNASLQKGLTIPLYNWLTFGSISYHVNFYVDSLTVVMLVVVTAVSVLVQFYSQEYIESEEPRGYSRFFAWLSLFAISMMILTLSANFLMIFIGWELVGVSSYLLIGFLGKDAPKIDGGRPSPSAAALKAFVTNRVGDFGFLIGIMILFAQTGTFTFTEIPQKLQGTDVTLITAAMILVFCGAVGKSAQFPLHVWLPDAMEGPTPVSALIHAATMVAAGVYLVARTFLLFHAYAGPQASMVVAYTGGFTALFAALIATVQVDLKRVLAYSTISQLGYMFVGLGVAGTDGPGMFHLMTHAFFKALLFLGSGGVLHALSGQQNMRKMGGLATKIPLVAFPFLLATLSISGMPFLSGFFSKDEIIAQTLANGDVALYVITVFTAFLTAFYMFRAWFLTFGGKGGALGGLWGGKYRGEVHPHAPGIRIWLPLMLLAIPTVFLGYWGFAPLGGNFNAFITGNPAAAPFGNPFADPMTYVSIALAFLGIGIAWLMYGMEVIPADALTRNPVGKGLHALFFNKFYVDELYMALIRFGIFLFAKIAVSIDKYVIDGIINGIGSGVLGIGRGLRKVETGRLQNYGAAFFGGALIIAAAFIAVVYFGK